MKMSIASSPQLAASHLQPEIWSRINRLHVRKAISEFAHECLIRPLLQHTQDGWGHYVLATDKPDIEYRFRARVLSLDHWHIDKDSIEKFDHGKPAPLDSLSFILEFSESMGIDAAVLPTYMEEITSTLYSSAYKHAQEGLSAAELTRADFQDVETAMMEGHPGFVANNGRIGFDAIDYRAYAPEAATPVALIWLAAHKSRARFACIDDLTYGELLQQELGTAAIESFNATLRQQGLDPESYLFMPVHPWQWFNKLASIFAPDIAARHLVCLGYGEDAYLAQQSIRTFFNTSHPRKRYVKTALSVLNMGFMRGLSPYYMSTTPAINQWIGELIERDAYLSKNGFTILREVASVAGYAEPRFWRLVADCLLEYQRAHPTLEEKFERYDLFAPQFIRSCLNRLQLGNNQQMIDLANPAKNLKFAGTLKNPIAAFKPEAAVGQVQAASV